MKWLEELLKELLPDNEELQKTVVEKAGAYIGENYVSAEDFSNTNSELEGMKTNMTELETKLKDLATSEVENQELKTKISEISGEYDNFKSETAQREVNRKKTNIVTEALKSKNANPEAMDLLLNDFKLDELVLGEDGKIKDLDGLVDSVKENRKSLFGTIEVDSVGAEDKKSDSGEYKPQFGKR